MPTVAIRAEQQITAAVQSSPAWQTTGNTLELLLGRGANTGRPVNTGFMEQIQGGYKNMANPGRLVNTGDMANTALLQGQIQGIWQVRLNLIQTKIGKLLKYFRVTNG